MRLALLCLVAVLGLAIPAFAQRPQKKNPAAGARPGQQRAMPARPGPRQNVLDDLMSLPPERQKEFVRANPRFQSLPPRQREQVLRQMDKFNGLPPARREALRERYELFRQLPAERQDHARALYRRWSQFAPQRRQELMREFRQLRDGSPEDRRHRLESDDFRNRYGDSERELLRGLLELNPPQ